MALPPIALIGPGRLGRALARALQASGVDLRGPFGREWRPADLDGAGLVLLCVPDAAIATVAAALPQGPIVGHCAASLGLEVLAPHRALSLHPLLSVSAPDVDFRGAACAVDGSAAEERRLASALGEALGMFPIEVPAGKRALYHAAASMASNFLVTVEGAAESLARSAGVPRGALAPLVRGAVEQWIARGAADALTGPIARGDRATTMAQRGAVAESAPEHLALWDALASATAALAASRSPNSPPNADRP